MHNFLSFFFIAFLCLPGFAQEDVHKEPLSPGGAHVIIRNNSNEPVTEIAPAAPGVEDEDPTLELIRAEEPVAVPPPPEPSKPRELTPIEQIHNLGYEQIDAKALMDDRVLIIMQKLVRDGGMGQVSDADMKKTILTNVEGTFLERFFKRSPRLMNFFSAVVRDKEAMAGLIGIMIKKEDLKNYGYIWIAIFIFGLWIKSRLVKPKWEFLRRLKWNMSINFVLSVISFYVFYLYFDEELSPTLAIFSKNFF